MGEKGEEFRREKSWGQSTGTSKMSSFTIVRSEATFRVFPGQPQSVQTLEPRFLPTSQGCLGPSPSAFSFL